MIFALDKTLLIDNALQTILNKSGSIHQGLRRAWNTGKTAERRWRKTTGL